MKQKNEIFLTSVQYESADIKYHILGTKSI